MWRRIANWYKEWEEEQIAVLERPELASRSPHGYRRLYYAKLAKLSPLERQQMRDFSIALKGWRGWLWGFGLLAVFLLCGVVLHQQSDLSWPRAMVVAVVCGTMLSIAVIAAWFNYRQLLRHKLKILLVALAYVGIGALSLTASSVWLKGLPFAQAMERVSHFLSGIAVGGLVIMVPVLAISILRNRQYEALNAQLQRETEQERLARELSESQLRLLRAQIEPHFLFNTLGAVQQLAQHGAPRAAELTGNLIDFLRSSMRDMRSEQVCLSAEFGLAESYLKVMQVRLGERLRFTLQLPRALEEVKLPSMILLTLVENAIKHGIEPALRGGEIALSAEAREGAVLVRVRDSGVGMSTLPAPAQCTDGGSGTGLENVRHRLRLTYGSGAGLELRDGDPGLIAELTIPHSTQSTQA